MVNVELILYVMLGAVIGMVYALRRIIMMEHRIIDMEKTIIKVDGNIMQLMKRRKR